MNKEQKIIVFKYFLHQSLEWWQRQSNKKLEENDFGTTKIMNLLFFISSVENGDKYYLLKNIFNNFYTLPMGPVERDIYVILNKNRYNINPYIIKLFTTEINNNISSYNIISEMKRNNIDNSENICRCINNAINSLKEIDNNFILNSRDDLVKISHKWFSWRRNMKIAKDTKKRAHVIKVSEIEQDYKTYSFDPLF